MIIAIVGSAPNWQAAKKSKADLIFGVNFVWKRDIEFDVVFDMHELTYYSRDKTDPEKKRHWQYLQDKPTYKVISLLNDQLPYETIEYPINDAVQLLKNINRAGSKEKTAVFLSSFDYMIAYAILKGATQIEVYGFDFGHTKTEYKYQIPGKNFWLGYCAGRGIDLILEEETALLNYKMYGYEGVNMIQRQELEKIEAFMTAEFEESAADHHVLQGELNAWMKKAQAGDKEAQQVVAVMQEEALVKFQRVAFNEGKLTMLKLLISEIDTGEATKKIKERIKHKVEVAKK